MSMLDQDTSMKIIGALAPKETAAERREQFVLPEQAGWAVELHGVCVLFATNTERAIGLSPGANTRVFTEAQVLTLLAAERDRSNG